MDWVALLICPDLSSIQKPTVRDWTSMHQLPVLESEQNWVVWTRYVGAVLPGPHIRWQGGVLQYGGPAHWHSGEVQNHPVITYQVVLCGTIVRFCFEDGPLGTQSAEQKLISKSPFDFKHVTTGRSLLN